MILSHRSLHLRCIFDTAGAGWLVRVFHFVLLVSGSHGIVSGSFWIFEVANATYLELLYQVP